MKKFGDAKKDKIVEQMIDYIVDEDFPNEHLEALFEIVTWFNWNENSEREIFEFSKKLPQNYFGKEVADHICVGKLPF